MKPAPKAALLLLLALLAAPVLADESARSLYNKGKDAETRQDYEKAYEFFQKAWDKKPKEVKYRVSMQRTRFLASASYVHRGQQLRDKGQLEEAMQLFQKAKEIDPSSFIADQEVRRTQALMDAAQNLANAPANVVPPRSPVSKRLEEAEGPIELAPIAETPITLRMTEDTRVIYETIGKLAGINVLFDPDYTPRRVKIDLNGVTLNQALDILALESKTFWRPVTSNTIFVASDTVAKRKELEQNVIRTFYMTNMSAPTELQDTVNLLRTLLEISRIQAVVSQGAIVMRGTPDQVALAEKLINDLDKAKPEVVIEVAVLQVRRDKLLDLGIQPPTSVTGSLTENIVAPAPSTGSGTGTGTTTPTPTPGTTPGSINLNSLANLTARNIVLTIPSATANFLYNDSTTKVIQNPQIRALDGMKASLKIGDRVPVATGSFQPGIGGVGINPLVNTQFQYIDVGVNIDIEPHVHAGREVTLKIMLDISSVTSRVNIGGIDQPVIGQRKIEHTIRLKEGEVNLLGGILEEQDIKSLSGLPGLSQIPFFKYFFSSTNKERVENEIVFMLIPRIVRAQELTEMNLRAVDVGTGSAIDLRRGSKVQPAGPQSTPMTAPGPVQPAPQPAPQGTPPQAQLAPPAASGAAAAPAAQSGGKPTPVITETQNAPAGGIAFRFDPEAATQTVGSTFGLNLVVNSSVPLWQVAMQVNYDPKLLQLVNVSNGGFLSQDGQPAAVVHRPDETTGTLQVSATRPPQSEGVAGQGAVLTLTFLAKAPGQSLVTVGRPTARNADGQLFSGSQVQAQITVK